MLFGFREITLHQVGFTEVFVRAAVPRIEGQSLLIVLHCRIELPPTAIGVAKVVLDIGIAGVAKARFVSALIAPSQSPATIARLPAAKSGSSAAQSGVSTIAAMVEQIGQASAALAVPDTALSGLASVAARSWRAGGVKKYDAGTAVNTPTTAAIRIERIMIVVPLAGRRTRCPAAVLLILCLGSLLLDQRGLGLADFHPIGIGVLGHLSKLSEIFSGLLG